MNQKMLVPEDWGIVDFSAEQLSLSLKTQPAHDRRKQPAQVKKCDPGYHSGGGPVCKKETETAQGSVRSKTPQHDIVFQQREKFLKERQRDFSNPFSPEDLKRVSDELSSTGHENLISLANGVLKFFSLFMDGKKKPEPFLELDTKTNKIKDVSNLQGIRGGLNHEDLSAIADGPAGQNAANPAEFKKRALQSIGQVKKLSAYVSQLSPSQQDVLINITWKALPEAYHKTFALMGSPNRSSRVFAGYDIKDKQKTQLSVPYELFAKTPKFQEARGKEVLRLYLLQSGSDGYLANGRHVHSPLGVTIDHMNPRKSENDLTPWDVPSNWIITKKNINSLKGQATFSDFIKSIQSKKDHASTNPDKHDRELEASVNSGLAKSFSVKKRITERLLPVVMQISPKLTGDFGRDLITLQKYILGSAETKPEAKVKTAALQMFGAAHWTSPNINMRGDKPGESAATVGVAKTLWKGIVSGLQSGAPPEQIRKRIRVVKAYANYEKFSKLPGGEQKAEHYLMKAKDILNEPTLLPSDLKMAGEKTLAALLPQATPADRAAIFS